MSVFLPTKDQNLRLGDRAGSKPVLDVILEALRPNLDQLPVRRLIARISVKSLNICYRWLISTQHAFSAHEFVSWYYNELVGLLLVKC